jgi:hypothetical protein
MQLKPNTTTCLALFSTLFITWLALSLFDAPHSLGLGALTIYLFLTITIYLARKDRTSNEERKVYGLLSSLFIGFAIFTAAAVVNVPGHEATCTGQGYTCYTACPTGHVQVADATCTQQTVCCATQQQLNQEFLDAARS